MYYASYDRRDSTPVTTALISSLSAGTVATVISHPFDFLKTKIQLYNEGIGLTGRRFNLGYNMYTVFKNFSENGYGTSVLYTGLFDSIMARLSYLAVRNVTYTAIYEFKKPEKWRNDLTHYEKMVISGFSGVLGALASNAFECQLVWRIGDVGRKAKFQRNLFNYSLSNGL